MDLLTNITEDFVRGLESSPLVQVLPTDSIRSVIDRMRSASTGCALVCDASGLVGIFTERDVLRRVLVGGVELSDAIESVMTVGPATVSPNDSVAEAIGKMQRGGHRHVPVVEAGGTVIGVVSVRAVVSYLAEYFAGDIYNLPPDPAKVHASREGA